MKGKISKNGFLYIERCGAMIPQICKWMNKNCGDNCPFFNDPQKVSFSHDISILICDRTVLKFNEFKDKRESKR